MSQITVRPTSYESIEPLRAQLRAEAGCQIVRDSILRRGLAQPYSIRQEDREVGYGGVWVEHDPGRIMEFWIAPGDRGRAPEYCGALVRASSAHEIEAQTNLPLMHAMMDHFGLDPRTSHLLFEDARTSALPGDGWMVRAPTPSDGEVDADWVVEDRGAVVGQGGLMSHYNPPYLDVYMSVEAERRREGIGAWLVQQLCAIAHGRGAIAAARCAVDNEASRRTLLRGGMREVGRIEWATVNRELLAEVR